MPRFRFNIAGLVGLVLICGVAVAALKESSDLWESAVSSFTLIVLMTSVLLAIHRTKDRRHFWVGFALFGMCYLGLSLIPPVEARLISSKLLVFLHSKLPGQPQRHLIGEQIHAVAFSPDGQSLTQWKQGIVGIWDAASGKLIGSWGSSTDNFVKIGHSWLALLTAWLGGLISRRLSRTALTADSSGVSCPNRE